MKKHVKSDLCLLIPITVILVYMLIIWFCVPYEYYNDWFAVSSSIRELILFLPKTIYIYTVLCPLVLAILLSLICTALRKFSGSKAVMIIQTAISTVCILIVNVFYIKFEIFGVDYAAHTIVLNKEAFADPFFRFKYMSISMFDVLYVLLIVLVVRFLINIISTMVTKRRIKNG